MKNKLGAILRTVLVLLMGATTAMTLLGAVGTTCLAWNGNFYGPAFKWIVPYMPAYQNLVYLSLAAGVALAIATYAVARGDQWFYIGSLLFLSIAGGAAAYQMYMTSTLKSISFFAAAPTNIRLYITAVTLLAFLLIRIPRVWNKSGLGNPGSGKGNLTTPTGLAMMLCGLMLVTAPLWAAPEHVVDGFNYVTTLEIPLIVDGIALMLGGAGVLCARRLIALVRTRHAFVSEQ